MVISEEDEDESWVVRRVGVFSAAFGSFSEMIMASNTAQLSATQESDYGVS